jgi:hypothetical protein
MQIEEKQLKRQQLLLSRMGFYSSKIDGIWGPESITAMKKFEADPRFRPGVPNNGLPMRSSPPYPAGMYLEYDGLIYHSILSTDIPTLTDSTVAPVNAVNVLVADVLNPTQTQPQTQTDKHHGKK